MAIYAIGDIQGCFSAIRRLVDQLHFDPAHDRLWFVGDLVNRGPDSLAVLRWVKGLGEAAVTVLGNHDLHLLAMAEGIMPPRNGDTCQDVLTAPDRRALLGWLRRRRLLHVEHGFAMVHAGLLPQWSMAQAAQLAAEVERAMQGDDYRSFLEHLYRTKPNRWTDDLTGLQRLTVTTHAMTRIRACAPDGSMDFSETRPPSQLPPYLTPWFQLPDRRSADTTIICGHWAALGLHVQDNLLALDTGCVWGGCLTAARLEDRQVFQVSCAE